MRTATYLLAALLVFGVFLANLRGTHARPGPGNHGGTGSVRPELEYLKAVNSAAPPRDPQLLFLSIIGLLRAQHAPEVSLLRRYGYVKDTIATLEQAKQLSGGKIFVVNWIAGIVHAELPSFFGQRKAGEAELAWCVENGDKAPHAGWLREVYYHLGKVALVDGEQAKAQDDLRRSGYTDFNKPITLATPFSEEVASGHTFAPRRIAEIVPRRLFVLTGFEFTEYYFVVSDDGRQLVGIDAGTRPDSAKRSEERR